ncbi:MAG: saccharopine dehydrogenase NADP-binding domain-containing protein [Chitinophagaceae bacterium]|nr:saccharopine dehydrogenase NADP-binding domain-containing protein [Chitinophagaceae bacterium]
MKHVLVFGAGKSATVLIDYLLSEALQENWLVTVVDADLIQARSKIGDHSRGKAISFDIKKEEDRRNELAKADIVISMLPPHLHILVAKDCIIYKKNLLTASYVDEQVKMLIPELEKENILFLYEMGLDPGIDHMSAMKIIHQVQKDGGRISSFKSHCGGLVAPESDDNPWHYKISWNPRNIVMAGKSGADFLQDGENKHWNYQELFSSNNLVEIPGIGILAFYPNRDSRSYISWYGLQSAQTFIRTTLRHPDFMYGWKNIIELNLTDETVQYETDGRTLAAIFKKHLEKNGFNEWLQEKMTNRFSQTKELMENLVKLNQAEKAAAETGEEVPDTVMIIDKSGDLEQIELEDIKTNVAATIAGKLHEANLTLKQLIFLGLDDDETIINKGKYSAADVLQFALEKKLALQPHDKDMIVMLHEIEFEKEGQRTLINSSLVVKGNDSTHTAMAKTVGMPLGIAAKLILNGTIKLRGLHVPVTPEIYEPVLKELALHGIQFNEESVSIH